MTEEQIAKMIVEETNAELQRNPLERGIYVGPVFSAMAKAISKVIVKALDERMDRLGMKDV